MKSGILLTTALGITFSGVLTTTQVQAQNLDPSPANAGYFRPVARVNPERPVTVILINQAGLPLDYILTEQGQEGQLATDGSIELKNVSLPSQFFVNPSSPSSEVTLDYVISTANNVTSVVIRQTILTDGDRAFNLDETGAIYIY